ncbi:hypothetical protein AB0D58_34550 [Streptomyces sp. NPDC048210]|uniref:hypothetical protein n=1 Tax=Streptomyces sp. NPDC048210 TaxID=3156657 RepID=UPI003429D45B
MHMDADRLARSSRKWMTAAFAAYSDGPSSHDVAVHHAGVATEHLLKAYLVSLHPALIVDSRDFNSVLYATGHGALRQVRGTQVKTIQLAEAYERVALILVGKVPPKPKGPWALADARNGVSHCGYHDPAEVNTVFTLALKVIDPLLEELAIGPEYWGSNKELHDHLIGTQVEETRLELHGKLLKARRTFSLRYGHLHDPDRALLLAAISPVLPRGAGAHDSPADCPACSTPGSLSGDLWADVVANTVMMFPAYFDCAACGLRLEYGELELVAEPLGDPVDLGIAPGDFFEDYEPDEDFDLSDEGDPDDPPDEDSMVDAYMNR